MTNYISWPLNSGIALNYPKPRHIILENMRNYLECRYYERINSLPWRRSSGL